MSRMLEAMANRVPTGKAINLEIGSAEPRKDDAYARIVRFFYSQSWEPAGENDPTIAAKAKVTIASDGKVSAARIVQSSGDARLDESVQRTLDHVQFIEPFEPGAKENERSYTINFRVGSAGVAAE
jgi:TonB family protein